MTRSKRNSIGRHAVSLLASARVLTIVVGAMLWAPPPASAVPSIVSPLPKSDAVVAAPTAPVLDDASTCESALRSVFRGLTGCDAVPVDASAGDARDAANIIADAADLSWDPRARATMSESVVVWGFQLPPAMPPDTPREAARPASEPPKAAILQQPVPVAAPMDQIEAPSVPTWITRAIAHTVAAILAAWGLWLARLFPAWLRGRYLRVVRRFDAMALGVRRVVTVDEIGLDDAISPAQVRQRGWSPECMLAVLGPPDYAVVDPQGLRDPIILLSRRRVEMLESSEQHRRFYNRRLAQAEAADARINKWLALCHSVAAHDAAVG